MIYIVMLLIFLGFLVENIEFNFFKDWYFVMLIVIYNMLDFVGKLLIGMYVLESIGKVIWGCMGSILFYFLFSGCFWGLVWLSMEGLVVVLMLMFGLSNGYLMSVVMIFVFKIVLLLEVEMVVIVMVVFLGMGFVVGLFVGWFWII